MKVGDKVKLLTFNGSFSACGSVSKSENYWHLIDKTGEIMQDPNEPSIYAGFSTEKRVLVHFDEDIESMGLHCHNNFKNALWILESDLLIL